MLIFIFFLLILHSGMLFVEIISSVLVFFLVALAAGNNLSVATGPLIAGRLVKKNIGITIAILGYITGFIVEGNFLRAGIGTFLPYGNFSLVLIILIISICMFLFAHRKGVPESLSITFTSALIGATLAFGNKINTYFTIFIIAFWVLASLFSILFAYYFMNALRKRIYYKNVWKTVSTIRLLLLFIAFFTAFTLGANTIGLIYASMPGSLSLEFIIILGIILGSIFLSSRELKRIGQDLIPIRYTNALVSQSVSIFMVELATLFGIPLSNTLTLTSGIYGSGLSYKTRLIMKKPALSIVSTWIFTGVLSFVLSYLAVFFLIPH